MYKIQSQHFQKLDDRLVVYRSQRKDKVLHMNHIMSALVPYNPPDGDGFRKKNIVAATHCNLYVSLRSALEMVLRGRTELS